MNIAIFGDEIRSTYMKPIAMKPIAAFLLLAVLAALWHVLYLPIAERPDSAAYLRLGAQIKAVVFDQGGSVLDVEGNFRVLGYPAILALLDYVTSGGHRFAVHLLQLAAAIVSGAVLCWTLIALRVPAVPAVVLALIYTLSAPFEYAGFVLTDSLNNALTAVIVCLLTLAMFDKAAATGRRFLLAGILLAIAFFLRDVNRYLLIALLPLAIAGLPGRVRLGRGAFLLFCFVAPVLVSVVAYKAFNAARIGQPVLPNLMTTVRLQSILPLAKVHPALFDGRGAYDAIVRAHITDYSVPNVIAILGALRAQKVTNAQVNTYADKKVKEAWTRFPFAMSRLALSRTRLDKQATILWNPVGATYESMRWRNGQLLSETSLMRQAVEMPSVKRTWLAMSFGIGRAISIVVFALGLTGAIWLGARAIAQRWWRFAAGIAALLASYMGYVLAYACAHLETRYLGGIAVIIVILAGLIITQGLNRLDKAAANPTKIEL